MSTRYGLRCETCDELSVIEFKDNVLRALVEHARAFIEVKAVLDDVWEIGEIKINQDYDEPYLLEFLRDHIEHRISLHDEYGSNRGLLKFEGQMAT